MNGAFTELSGNNHQNMEGETDKSLKDHSIEFVINYSDVDDID